VAVLAHDFPELSQIVDGSRCGHTVDSSCPASIAAGINRMLDDRAACMDMGRRGRAAVKSQYNFRVQCEGMVAMYERILRHTR